MPEGLMSAYARELPRLRAQRQLDAADVAITTRVGTASQRGSEAFERWVQRLTSIANAARHSAEVFTLNGSPISVKGIRRQFGKLLGPGYSDE